MLGLSQKIGGDVCIATEGNVQRCQRRVIAREVEAGKTEEAAEDKESGC